MKPLGAQLYEVIYFNDMLENMYFVNINMVLCIIKSHVQHYNFREVIILSPLLYSIGLFPAQAKPEVVEKV